MVGLRRFLTPGWLLLHAFTVAAVITMILLGRWQLIVSDRKHFNLQNFGYAIQWWLFSAFALYLWWRFIHDARHGEGAGDPDALELPAADTPDTSLTGLGRSSDGALVTYRRYVMPTAGQVDAQAEDDMQSSYNDYLRTLNESAAPAPVPPGDGVNSG